MLDLTFHRRAGSLLDYLVTGTTDLRVWTGEPDWTAAVKSLATQCDGTGTAVTTLRATPPLTKSAPGLLRVQALPHR